MTKFLIIGNKSNVIYKCFFHLIKDNKVWLGHNVPNNFLFEGKPSAKINGLTRWFTNIENSKQNNPLTLVQKYNPEKYPKYDNYDAIECSKVKDIPCDYFDLIGVPATFIDKYCPEQFEIFGQCTSHSKTPKGIPNENCYINGKWIYNRILIKRKL